MKADLLIANLQALGDEDAVRSSDKEVLGEQGQVAMQAVVDARNALARRGQASGVPLSLFTIERGYGDAFALHAHGARAARLARARIESFNDRAWALGLIEQLEEALAVLAPMVDAATGLSADATATTAKRAALKRELFDALTWLAPWGRDVVAGDLTKRGRYELDQIFPTRTKKVIEDPNPVS